MAEQTLEPVQLGQLLEAAQLAIDLPAEESLRLWVRGLDYDSRRIEPGWLFFAFAGSRADGRRFAAAAMEKGAVGVVSQEQPPPGFSGLWIRVPHARQAMALMARCLYAAAAEQTRVAGVTGTNAKTTVCTLTDRLLRAAGRRTALVGTIEYQVAGRTYPAPNTTPEALDLYRLFDELRAAGGRDATMEVSSHALSLGRVHGVKFHTAVFTNLSRDHLDFHPDMESYFAAKCELFRGQQASPPEHAVVNRDDAWAHRIPLSSSAKVVWYGLSPQAELHAGGIEADMHGLRFTLHWQGRAYSVQSPLAGRINVYNLLAAFGAGLAFGLEPEAMVETMRRLGPVAGRFERVDLGQPFLAVVDYAHTDDALRNAISVARQVSTGRVITLFGCGGDRDREKRPLMGQAAGELSDFVVLTSDNPRSEDPLVIINDALVGLRRTDVSHRIEPDRRRAIRLALEEARPGDVVLIAGKGHEPYQELASGKIHFDDRETTREILKEFGYGREEAR
ncbi:MAG: UDP-N-acetylmuramoyl-L-alanyl-D-glutamate--2,6-diaminopimelate ligase [Acidimicrobiia bacterium]|nr:UDP-N-acetylmuramoyl-L-alanyl-D-glutamate--2,6-diaminopimelate ligase [Acidimicrobiia bacterium]